MKSSGEVETERFFWERLQTLKNENYAYRKQNEALWNEVRAYRRLFSEIKGSRLLEMVSEPHVIDDKSPDNDLSQHFESYALGVMGEL